MTNKLYQILFFRELQVDIEKETKVTERSRNQKTHGEEAVSRKVSRNSEAKQQKKDIGESWKGFEKCQELQQKQASSGAMDAAVEILTSYGIYRLRIKCQFLGASILCLFKLFAVLYYIPLL